MRTFVRLAVLFLAASSAAFAAPKSKIKTDAGVERILTRRIDAGGSGLLPEGAHPRGRQAQNLRDAQPPTQGLRPPRQCPSGPHGHAPC